MSRAAEEEVKLFGMTNQLLEHDLDRIEQEYAIDLQRGHQSQAVPDETYYPQIDAGIRAEAAAMAPHYEIFYSLETSIRTLIEQTLEDAEGTEWWDSARISQQIRQEAEAARQREKDSGMTPRSDDMLDFTNFGELSQIIEKNWDLFGSTFSSVRAVKKVLANLNTLRGPIAHCSPLAEDEVVRLRLSVSDWFRLME
jgi:HEPN superfamily Swt1-like protein